MPTTEDLFERYGPSYRWLATVTALVAAVAVILSATIVNVAIPDIMGAFGISQIKAQWLSTAFLAAMTATMLLTDWAIRALGHRGSIVSALSLFIAGSVLGGFAPDENTLILARVIQGAAAGIVQPLAMIIIFQVFPPERRGAAMGIFGVGVVLAPALGPWVGGVLMDAFNWRYVFYLGAPFAVIGIALASLFLPTRRADEARPGFDWIGFALLAVFLASLLNALSNGQRLGWRSDPILLQLAVATAVLVAFVWWERHTAKPMLDLRLFLEPPFAAAAVVSFVLGAGLFGTTYLVPLFVQTIQGLSPTQAGLLLMPAGFVLVMVFPLAGRLSDVLPCGVLIGVGLAVFAYSSYLTSQIDTATGFWLLAWWVVLSRVGLGLVFPALSAGSLRVLPAQLMAQGSGAINFTRQLGGAFGVNLLAVILERRTMFHADALTATQTPANATTAEYVSRVAAMLDHIQLPDVQQSPAALYMLGQAIYREANTLGYQDGFLVTAAIFLAALVPTWILHQAQRRRT